MDGTGLRDRNHRVTYRRYDEAAFAEKARRRSLATGAAHRLFRGGVREDMMLMCERSLVSFRKHP